MIIIKLLTTQHNKIINNQQILFLYHEFRHINALVVHGVKRFLKWFIVKRPFEKALSEGVLVAGTARYFFAIFDKHWKWSAFNF